MAHNRVQGSKTQGDKHKAQTTKKDRTGQWQSESENKIQDQESNRNSDVNTKDSNGYRKDEKNFDLLVDGVPYSIRTIPFLFNEEMRFRVIVNEDTEHIFTWDSEIKMLRAIDDDASTLPDGLEEAISEKLQSMK